MSERHDPSNQVTRRAFVGGIASLGVTLSIGCEATLTQDADAAAAPDGGMLADAPSAELPDARVRDDAPDAPGRTDAHAPTGDFGVLGMIAASMSEGEWRDVSASTGIQQIVDVHPDGGGPVPWTLARLFGGGTPLRHGTDWPGKATWDPVTRQVILVGSSAGAITAEAYEGQSTFALYLDIATGQLRKIWNPLGTIRTWHQYDANCSRPLGRFLYRRGGDSGTALRRMNLDTDVWETVTMAREVTDDVAVGVDVHPTLGTQGSVLIAGTGGRLARYDVASGMATLIAPSHAGVEGLSPVISYHPGIDAVVFGGGDSGRALYTINAAGTVRRLTDTAPLGVTQIGPAGGRRASVFLPDPRGRALAHLVDYSEGVRKHWTLDLNTGAYALVGDVPIEFGVELAACAASIPELGCLLWVDGNINGSTTNRSRVWLTKVR